MVKDHVGAIRHSGGILPLAPTDAHPYAQIATDQVVGTGEGDPVAIKHDPVAGRSVGGNGQVLRKGKGRLQLDNTRYFEYDNPVRAAYGITQGAPTGIGQRRDQIDPAEPPAYGMMPIPLGTGEGQHFAIIRKATGERVPPLPRPSENSVFLIFNF